MVHLLSASCPKYVHLIGELYKVPAIWPEACFELWAEGQVFGHLVSVPSYEQFDHTMRTFCFSRIYITHILFD